MRKSQEEVKEELRRRRNQYEKERRTRRKHLLGGSAALAICLAVVLLIGHIASPSPDLIGGPTIDSAANVPAKYNLMANIRPLSVVRREADDPFVQAQKEFAIELLRNAVAEKRGDLETMKEGGVLLCPLSAELALAMAANGAEGETLRQMEKVLGGGMPIEQLNEYLRTYTAELPSVEGSKMELANSIWLPDDRPAPFGEFLQTNANYYGAGAFQAPLGELCGLINGWVKEQTDGMIEKLFEELPESTMMVLVNTVLFDGTWDAAYAEKDVQAGSFTAYNGTQRTVTMMSSYEDVTFWGEDGTMGFLKPYKDDRYAFVALLPKEGVDILDYVSSLTVEKLETLLNNRYEDEIYVKLPKFSFSWEQPLGDVLRAMGMSRAFGESAEFTKMFPEKDNLSLSLMQQNTAIEISETGTKAAAATGEVLVSTIATRPIILDRPFVYMILDTETNLPLFLGVLTDIQ